MLFGRYLGLKVTTLAVGEAAGLAVAGGSTKAFELPVAGELMKVVELAGVTTPSTATAARSQIAQMMSLFILEVWVWRWRRAAAWEAYSAMRLAVS